MTLVLYMDDRHASSDTSSSAAGSRHPASRPAPWFSGPRPARQPAASLSDMAAIGGFTPRKRRLPPSVPSPMQRPVTDLLSWTTWWWSREEHGPVSWAFPANNGNVVPVPMEQRVVLLYSL